MASIINHHTNLLLVFGDSGCFTYLQNSFWSEQLSFPWNEYSLMIIPPKIFIYIILYGLFTTHSCILSLYPVCFSFLSDNSPIIPVTVVIFLFNGTYVMLTSSTNLSTTREMSQLSVFCTSGSPRGWTSPVGIDWHIALKREGYRQNMTQLYTHLGSAQYRIFVGIVRMVLGRDF